MAVSCNVTEVGKPTTLPALPPPDTDVTEPVTFPGEGAGSETSELRPKRRCLLFPFQLFVDHLSFWSLLV